MNSLLVVAATIVAFVFGYRFYARLLALEIFRLDADYSTRAQSNPDGRDYVPTHPHLLLGHHIAAISGGAVFAAPAVALAWGWIPVFLWITIGSAVAAGTYALGSFWLSSRYPEDLGRLIYRLIGGRAHATLLLLTVVALLIVVAAAAGLSATLLAAYPEAALPSIALALLGWGFGSCLHGRAESLLLPVSIGALVFAVLIIWLLGHIPFAFNGALTVTLRDSVGISIDSTIVWVVLLLVYAFHAARLPVWKLMRPRGFLVALTLILLLLSFYVALIVQHPTITAPEFNSPQSVPHSLPWLFLVVGSGALAGWHFLIIREVTGRELRRETDAGYVGYGAALVQGLIALSAVLLGATAYAGRDVWLAHYAMAPNVADFPRAVVFYVDSYARLVTALGLDSLVATYFAATVIAGLSIAVLETAVRALKNVLIDASPPAPVVLPKRDGERVRLWLVVAGGGLLALHDGRGLGGLATWPVLALISLWLAAAGFALMMLALRAARRTVPLVVALAATVALAAAWSNIAQIWYWWQAGAWTEFGVGVLVLLLAAFLVRSVIGAARRPLPGAAPSPPT